MSDEEELTQRIERLRGEFLRARSLYQYRTAMGRLGEALAEQFLVERGANVVARNHRTVWGELDLIAWMDGDLVAVEVKTRLVGTGWRPEEAMTHIKLKRLGRLLAAYALATQDKWCGWRIDVVALEIRTNGTLVRMDHYRAA
jgi:putative endonuclease